MTKDQLIAENATLKAEIERLKAESLSKIENGNLIRQELSKALGAPPRPTRYGERESPMTYSWFEIFRELGKLLAARTFLDLEGNVSELDVKTKELDRRVRTLEPQDGPF